MAINATIAAAAVLSYVRGCNLLLSLARPPPPPPSPSPSFNLLALQNGFQLGAVQQLRLTILLHCDDHTAAIVTYATQFSVSQSRAIVSVAGLSLLIFLMSVRASVIKEQYV